MVTQTLFLSTSIALAALNASLAYVILRNFKNEVARVLDEIQADLNEIKNVAS